MSESFLDEFGIPHQRMVPGLRRLHEHLDFDHKILFLERLNELVKGRPILFEIYDKKNQPIELLNVRVENEIDQTFKSDNAASQLKMYGKFTAS